MTTMWIQNMKGMPIKLTIDVEGCAKTDTPQLNAVTNVCAEDIIIKPYALQEGSA